MPVDVNVIDKSGRPVPDQAAGDFTLTVDGKPRRAVSAQFMSVDKDPDKQMIRKASYSHTRK